jgi:hypothetical protein
MGQRNPINPINHQFWMLETRWFNPMGFTTVFNWWISLIFIVDFPIKNGDFPYFF